MNKIKNNKGVHFQGYLEGTLCFDQEEGDCMDISDDDLSESVPTNEKVNCWYCVTIALYSRRFKLSDMDKKTRKEVEERLDD